MKSALLKKIAVSFLAASTIITGSALGTLNAEAASNKVKVWVIDTIEDREESKIKSTYGLDKNYDYEFKYDDKGLIKSVKQRYVDQGITSTTSLKYNDKNELIYVKGNPYNDGYVKFTKVAPKFDMSNGRHDMPYIYPESQCHVLGWTYVANNGKVVESRRGTNPSAQVIKYSYNKRGDLNKIVISSNANPTKYKNVYDDNGNLKRRKITIKDNISSQTTGEICDFIEVQSIKYKEIEVDKSMIDIVKAYQWAILNGNLNCAFNKVVFAAGTYNKAVAFNGDINYDYDHNFIGIWWLMDYVIY